MCRNIKPLFNFDPPVSADEVHAAALQYVRKISGFNKPSKANDAAFQAAVEAVAAASSTLLGFLETSAPPAAVKSRSPGPAPAVRSGSRKPGRRRIELLFLCIAGS